MNMPDFLTQDPDGYIHLTGHRIGIQDVIDFYNDGYSPEMLVEQYPTLSLATIYRTIAFYLDDRTGVDEYIERCKGEVERQRKVAPKGPDVHELRRRLEAGRLAEGA
jgi:uncharacterized protein (DUF433 family)